jgi:hypothetical protein
VKRHKSDLIKSILEKVVDAWDFVAEAQEQFVNIREGKRLP